MEVTDIEKKILDYIQFEFPLTERPFNQIGEKTGINEERVINIIKELTDKNIIRQISPVYDTKSIGYKSTLAAFKVAPENIDYAAECINSVNGVSHNYLRDDEFNIWFTLAVHPPLDVKDELIKIFNKSGAVEMLNLPTLKMYKIGVFFNFSANYDRLKSKSNISNDKDNILTEQEKHIIAVTQNNISLIQEPFNIMAEKLGMPVNKILDCLRDFNKRGIMRRFAAILNHTKAGMKSNVLTVWNIPEEQVEQVCLRFIKNPAISHCYYRQSYPNWQWNVYTMIHAADDSSADSIINELVKVSGSAENKRLKTVRELKKVRLRYFEEYL